MCFVSSRFYVQSVRVRLAAQWHKGEQVVPRGGDTALDLQRQEGSVAQTAIRQDHCRQLLPEASEGTRPDGGLSQAEHRPLQLHIQPPQLHPSSNRAPKHLLVPTQDNHRHPAASVAPTAPAQGLPRSHRSSARCARPCDRAAGSPPAAALRGVQQCALGARRCTAW